MPLRHPVRISIRSTRLHPQPYRAKFQLSDSHPGVLQPQDLRVVKNLQRMNYRFTSLVLPLRLVEGSERKQNWTG